MYKVTVFEKDQDTIMLAAYADSSDKIVIRDGVLIVHDVDGEFLMVPLDRIGHVSAVKDDANG